MKQPFKALAIGWHWLIVVVSGEWILKVRPGLPNGGGVIAARSLCVSLMLFAVILSVESRLQEGAVSAFSWDVARPLIAARLPWLGAIFAGVYTALYSRFSSQWTYLADLYNRIMEADLQLALALRGETAATPGPTTAEPAYASPERVMAAWKAAFVEDAEDLYLATKPLFAPALAACLSEPLVRDSYLANTVNGTKRLERLERRLEDAISKLGRSQPDEILQSATATLPVPHGENSSA